MFRSFRWLLPMGVLLGLGIGNAAHAGKVDWSDYLEPPGTKMKVTTTPQVKQAPAKKAQKAPRAASKQRVAKAKAKAKPAARRRR